MLSFFENLSMILGPGTYLPFSILLNRLESTSRKFANARIE